MLPAIREHMVRPPDLPHVQIDNDVARGLSDVCDALGSGGTHGSHHKPFADRLTVSRLASCQRDVGWLVCNQHRQENTIEQHPKITDEI